LDDAHNNVDASAEEDVEGTLAIPYERLKLHGIYRLPLTDNHTCGTIDKKGESMSFTDKQVMAISTLSQTFGELVGTLEGIAMREENKDLRGRMQEQASLFLEIDPIIGLLNSFLGDDDGDLPA
jgi:hypothetical protein